MSGFRRYVAAAFVLAMSALCVCGTITAFAEETSSGVIYAYQQSAFGPGSLGWQQQEDGSWKYQKNGAYVANDWVEIEGKWYRFNESGIMLTGWQDIGGQLYYLSQNDIEGHPLGSLYISEATPDGCGVDENGVRNYTPDPNTEDLVRANPYGTETCVEVSIGDQRIYVYQGADLVLTSSCVTGNVSAGHSTPVGNYRIYSKETNRYLQGTNDNGSKYKSFVNFWMPFNRGVGLHDADGWRNAYGGDIYTYSGSHGCVNLPYAKAAALYGIVYVGMPVHVHA